MKQVQFTAFGVPHQVAAFLEVPDVGAPLAGVGVCSKRPMPVRLQRRANSYRV
jgi:hypothetical protein